MGERIKGLVGSSYFEQKYFSNDGNCLLNSILSTTLAMYDYLETAIFNEGDSDRIVYAKNDYAFRARLANVKGNENSKLQLNTLNMPFLNFCISGISLSDTRLKSPYYAKQDGVYIPEIGKKLKMFPVVINFEGCFYTTQMADAQIVLARLFNQSSTQTLINPTLYYNLSEIENFAELTYDEINFDAQYMESDWLEQNRIHTVAFNIAVNTYMIDTNPGSYVNEQADNYCIVRDLYLKIGTHKNLNNWDGWTEKDKYETYHAIVDEITETVDWDFGFKN